jgi:secreted protein with Ig-like and vWFA domain
LGNKDEISQEELQAQSGQEVPDREAMSLVNANLALPINAAIAANVLSDGAVAYADATQQPTIDQSTIAPNPFGT